MTQVTYADKADNTAGATGQLTAANANEIKVAVNSKSDALVAANAQTGTTYTLVLTDADKGVTMSNASANTLTIPTNASVAFPVGTVLSVVQIGAGATTITGDTGVTVNGVSAGSGDISAQWGGVSLWKTATDTWIASGSHGAFA